MPVHVTFQGGDKFKAELRRKKQRVQKPELAWRKVGRHIAKEIRKQFTSRGANFGTPWKPLAPSTIREKRRLGYPLAPLIRTGEMRREMTGNPMNVEFYEGRIATFGTNGMKAEWQHFGTDKNGKVHIPARPILKATPKLRREVKDIMDEWVKKGLS
jgi:phage gpG-like protein